MRTNENSSLKRSLLTVPSASVDLDPHADGPLEVRVRMKANLARHEDGVEVILDGRVRVLVGVDDRSALSRAVAEPLVQPRPVVFKQVGLGELNPLAVSEATLGLDPRDGVDRAEVDLDPLGALLADHVLRAPRAAVLIHADPATKAALLVAHSIFFSVKDRKHSVFSSVRKSEFSDATPFILWKTIFHKNLCGGRSVCRSRAATIG